MNLFKKIMFSVLGFSTITTSTSLIVSCEVPVDNTYKSPSDISRLWNFKSFKSISIDDLNLKDKKENGVSLYKELIKLIGFRFSDFDSSEIILNQDQEVISNLNFYKNKINFQIYANQNNDSLIIDSSSNSSSDSSSDSSNYIKNIKKYLDFSFINNEITEKSESIVFYFKYKIGDGDYSSSFLDFNITNKPLFSDKDGSRKLSGLIKNPNTTKEANSNTYILKIDDQFRDSFKVVSNISENISDEELKNYYSSINTVVKGLFFSIYKKFNISANDFEMLLSLKLMRNSSGDYTYKLQLSTPEEFVYYSATHDKKYLTNLISISKLQSDNSKEGNQISTIIFGVDFIKFV
ncbi:hypothetical protein SCORR_v1c04870 [Spiroplasma corruscae]|uniref:Lipoprotein n=1 Tax=Spiroplasma corruscae TaxID=216934 RepID=A0A222EP21_9MOLU|nr:hypothetical protein [Spiroplasma corruscae]ASP28259.1 hypothetical protein SCORR_v1c04870 [Spiroplasma corruscae]